MAFGGESASRPLFPVIEQHQGSGHGRGAHWIVQDMYQQQRKTDFVARPFLLHFVDILPVLR